MRTSTILTVLTFPMTIAFASPARAGEVCSTQSPCLDIRNFAVNGTAIIGGANKTNGVGVMGMADTIGGRGISGISLNGGIGVSGSSTGTQANGVGGIGVDGYSNAVSGYGVRGTINAIAGSGVIGSVSPPGTATGVFGDNTSQSGWAGYFNGRLFASSGYVSSDERLKKDIADMRYGLDQVLRLRPVTFKWKSDEQGLTQLGLIAQEVDKIVPEIVDHGSGASPMLSVNYTSLVPVVINGMQEQQKVILRMEARIAELERARRPVLASISPEGQLFGGLALGLVPLGMVLASRRKRRSDD